MKPLCRIWWNQVILSIKIIKVRHQLWSGHEYTFASKSLSTSEKESLRCAYIYVSSAVFFQEGLPATSPNSCKQSLLVFFPPYTYMKWWSIIILGCPLEILHNTSRTYTTFSFWWAQYTSQRYIVVPCSLGYLWIFHTSLSPLWYELHMKRGIVSWHVSWGSFTTLPQFQNKGNFRRMLYQIQTCTQNGTKSHAMISTKPST